MAINKIPDFPGKLDRGRNKKVTFSDAQIRWLKEVFPTTENNVIAKAAGCSYTTIYRVVKELGLKKSEEGLHGILKRQAMKAKRTCRRNGWYDELSRRMKETYRMWKDEWQRRGDMITEGYKSGRLVHYLSILKSENPKAYKAKMRKRSKERKKVMEEERKRIRLGLPRKTKLVVVDESYTHSQLNHRLNAVRRGYLVGDPMSDERMMIFYDKDTERSERFEKNLKKDGFIILPDNYEAKASHDYYNVGNL